MSKTLLLTVLVALVSGTVAAGEVYKVLDADKSGTISQQEAEAMPGLTDQWKDLDVNVDGQLDQEEFARFEFVEIKAPEETPGK